MGNWCVGLLRCDVQVWGKEKWGVSMLVGLKYGTPDDSAPGASTCFHAESRVATEAHYIIYF